MARRGLRSVAICLIACSRVICVAAQVADSSVSLDEVAVVAVKDLRPVRQQAISSSSFNMEWVSHSSISSIKDFSSFAPNFYQPDYGSQMTSSIYIRGLGARIDQPVMGLNVDNVPYMNKNNYDFDLFDVCRLEMLRGPQGTLYGRNTMCGVMNLYTLSPLSFQGMRFSADYSTGNTAKLKISDYRLLSENLGLSVAASVNHTDGIFTNEYDGRMCDPSDAGALRARLAWKPGKAWTVDNTFTSGLLDQGGYAYALYDDSLHKQLDVDYNDEVGYKRFSLMDALSLNYSTRSYAFSSVTSYQYLDDEMKLDQDFTPQKVFTLTQSQREHAVTQDFLLKSKNNAHWNWQFGLWGFYKHLDMDAPVTFKRDGIENLILVNANKGLQQIFPSGNLSFKEEEFVIGSRFDIPTYGTALYHQSELSWKKWLLTLGARLDYERATMDYRNQADVNYLFTLSGDYRPLHTALDGREETNFVEFLPKVSLQYSFNGDNNIYAYVAKGYKAGGFNTQIFSDILQNAMMNGLMGEFGVRMDGTSPTAKATVYDPEYSWNYELGGHFMCFSSSLYLDAALFYIDCRDQQLTVFPPGKNTGRMMTNAGKTRSFGAEASLTYSSDGWMASVAYGHTNAKFVDFDDGQSDYSGNFVPYSPSNTLSALLQRTFRLKAFVDKIVVKADGKAVGDIYWDESNQHKQSLYCLFGAGVSLHHKRMELGLWGKNLGGEEYDTFYFRSMGNSFFQVGKPRQMGFSFKYELNRN